MASTQKVLVVAIDFGTTYSGYAFSFKSNKNDVKTHLWETGIGQEQSTKAPTSILFDHLKRYHSFGYDAENQYSRLSDEQQKQYYYFKRFKMTLFNNQDLNERTMIKDVSGREMRAMDVFAAGIKYLRDHFHTVLRGQFRSGLVGSSEIQWVLTVPAIWNEAAKQFMRMAAVKAGISGDCLTLALEPEAAALYCQSHSGSFQLGNTFMIVDAGGGTVDVTVHKVRLSGKLQEVVPPSGGPWGGIKVDDAFQTFLMKIFGLAAIRKLSKSEILQIEREFEIVKRSFSQNSTMSAMDIRVPYCLIGHLNRSNASMHSIRIRGDKMNIPYHTLQEFFKGPVQKIVKHVRELMDKPELTYTNGIYLVGGFSKSRLLQDEMKQAFPYIQIHTPQEANAAIIKGAVIFGHDPNIIGWRKTTRTYGIDCVSEFDHDIHLRQKYTLIEGREYCSDIFTKFITVGTTMENGQATPYQSFCPVYSNQASVPLKIVTSPSESPTYTTDPGCRVIGTINVKMPDLTGGTDREVKVRMIMGGTELKVEAVDGNTGMSYSAKFDFL
ncbi:heat shock 70 kDa protein 12B-like [Pecten maximus]|uniref:heat shock 70 kDa protein 12B-like n=1 Tax=Pecten maximus TaxID=6579 RepID=UPI0014580349|nr:heat shock 70 kDa protein 12B-like [Pecten maximus]